MKFLFNGNKKSEKKSPIIPSKPPKEMESPGTYLRENGLLFLADDFKKETVMPLVAQIWEYNLMPKEIAPDRITLVINSPGGRIDSCLTLIDAMMTSEIPVDTFASGLAASCGILTLMAGKKRMASHTAQLMSHQYSAGSNGKEHELFGRLKSFEHTSNWMVEHYVKCTGLSEKRIRKELLGPTDVWLTAHDAKKFKIIDEVIETY